MLPAEGAALTYVEAEFGGPVEENDGVFGVTTTASRVLKSDPECLSLFMVNLGSSDIYVWINNSVASTRGILLASNGGSLAVNVRDDQLLQTREWWAVSVSGVPVLAYIRTRRYALSYPAPVA